MAGIAAQWPALGQGLAFAITLLVGIGIGLLIYWVRRQRELEDVREVVRVVEELRSGSLSSRAKIADSSSLHWINDALGRLHEDVISRWKEIEGASDRLEAVLSAVSDLAILSVDEDGDILSLSSGGAGILGYEESQVAGKPMSILFDENGWRDFLPKLSRKVLKVRSVQTRATLKRADGKALPVKVALRGNLDGRGRLKGYLLILREDQTREQIEQAVLERESQFSEWFAKLDQGVVILEKGKVIYANEAMESLCDFEGQALENASFRDLIASEDLLLIQPQLTESPKELGQQVTLNLRFREQPRFEKYEVHARGIRRGLSLAWLCTFRPLSDQKESKGTDSISFGALDVLRRSSVGLLWLQKFDESWRVRWAAQGSSDLFGFVPEAGERWESVLQEDDPGCVALSQLSIPLLTHRIIEFEREGLRRSFEVQWEHISEEHGLFRFRDASASVMREEELLAVIRAAEGALEDREQKLKQTTEKVDHLDQLCKELERLDKMKSRLLGNVAHELQTPLVSIRGFTEMIFNQRLGPLNEEQKKGLHVALKGIDRLIHMIEDLSGFTTLDENKPQISTWELRPLIEEIAELQSADREVKHLRWSLQMEEEAVVEADREQIAQVFINLLNNATKYNQVGGRIEVRVRRAQPELYAVEIEDTGRGIPEELREKIFEREVQVKDEDKELGKGIGLSVVRDILRMHGCEIRVRDARVQGSVFEFHLPAGMSENQEPAKEESDDTSRDSDSTVESVDKSEHGASKVETERRPSKPAESYTTPPIIPIVDADVSKVESAYGDGIESHSEADSSESVPNETFAEDEILEPIEMTTLEQVEVHEDQVPASSLDWDIEAMMDELEESPPRRQASEADEVKRETRDRNPSSSAESEPPRRKPKKLIEDRRFNVVRPKTND